MDLSRIARGGTPITLDRPRLVFYDAAALWLLIQKYGDRYLQTLYSVKYEPKKPDVLPEFTLNSMDALQFYLWVGLQSHCKAISEELTLEDVYDFFTPATYPRIFEAVITALGRNVFTPARKGEEAAGKADAAAARPAAVAESRPRMRKPSTSTKKNASRSARSAGRPKGSGPRH